MPERKAGAAVIKAAPGAAFTEKLTPTRRGCPEGSNPLRGIVTFRGPASCTIRTTEISHERRDMCRAFEDRELFLTLKAADLFSEAKMAMARGDWDLAKLFIRASIAKLNEAANGGGDIGNSTSR